MKCLARVSSPKVVCRADSGPSGTRSFNFSRHVRSWARLNNKKNNNNNNKESLVIDLQKRRLRKKKNPRVFGCVQQISFAFKMKMKKKKNAKNKMYLGKKEKEVEGRKCGQGDPRIATVAKQRSDGVEVSGIEGTKNMNKPCVCVCVGARELFKATEHTQWHR